MDDVVGQRSTQCLNAACRILTSMVGRLIAAAVVLVMTSAPVVTMACQDVCAARANDAGSMGEHHSCHHEATASSSLALTSNPHACGHADEGPTAVATSLRSLDAPALVLAVFTLAAPAPHAAQQRATTADHGPPLISPRPTQLRI